jgi:catechol 2,3-dioxygenase-like lactoylglutathione lyase family enzyme
MHVSALDHIVLNVADVERTLEFYQRCLGLQVENVDQEGCAWRPLVRAVVDGARARVRAAIHAMQDADAPVVGNEAWTHKDLIHTSRRLKAGGASRSKSCCTSPQGPRVRPRLQRPGRG